MALAVDSFIYFASIRPDYQWGMCPHSLPTLTRGSRATVTDLACDIVLCRGILEAR